ncbi:MAG TPA: NAD(P)H-dependent oxidoreductase [Candidatus Saccharimonadia bacterium]|nr:NAD(P)H-dependent oxidoreductase [Candidatus Saccharimonadia bacterium]
MLKIQIILGSTRPGRTGEAVARWAYEMGQKRTDFEVELVDVQDYDLPLLDEPVPPSVADQYTKEHTKRWSQKIAEADGYVIVTGEYNHGIPGALKNAIDFLSREWRDKSVGFVSYGSSSGGARAVEHLRGVVSELQLADVREQLMLFLRSDFENMKDFQPTSHHEAQLNKIFDQVVRWAGALKTLRN